MVRFIGKDNFILSHRYSILVKQFVQSWESFTFYETLRKFSGSESLFSQIRPGELPANFTRKDGTEERILAWVEAVSVSEQRLFFNFEDFFFEEELPDYPFGCNPFPVAERIFGCNPFGTVVQLLDCPPDAVEGADGNFYSFYDCFTPGAFIPICEAPTPYVVTPSICGDCRFLGSNVVPEFWIKE